MVSRTATLIMRAIRMAPVVTCVFAGCTCSGGPGTTPPPTATAAPRATQTPVRVAPVTNTPVAQAQPTATAPPTPNVEATRSAARPACEGYVAVLSGEKQDEALLNDPAVRALAPQVPDLVTCGAVRLDSEAHCMLLGSDREQNEIRACRQAQSLFHELRLHPKSPAFFMTDADWHACHDSPLAPVCDSLRDAFRSGDVSKCTLTQDFQAICRKQIPELNESQCRIVGPWMKRVTDAKCRAMVTLDTKACHAEQRDLKSGDLSKQMPDFFKEAEDECRQKTEELAPLGKGLSGLAESGPPRERALAQATLGKADACAAYAQAAIEVCVQGSQAAPPEAGTPPPGAPVPAGTSQPTGNAPGGPLKGNS